MTRNRRARSVWIALLLVALTPALASALPFLPAIERGDIAVNLRPVVTGLAAPLYGINPPGDTSRLFILEQNGLMLVKQLGSAAPPSVALDLQSRVQPPLNAGNANDERGLLGMAFHPGFFNDASPGYRTLYTYTSEPLEGNPLTFPVPIDPAQGGTNRYVNVVSEYKMTTPTSNVIDPASRRVVFTIGKDQGNHNGGTIAFGPDGMLYLATGDGGGANDDGPSHVEPTGNAQVLTGSNVLGKMLRIDPLHPSQTPTSTNPVSSNGAYRIPADNPFQAAGQVPEIYAYGLRNPYRFSFDTGNGELILADVGQRNIEEIDRIVRGGNYGWAVKEGTFLFDRPTGTIGDPNSNPPGNNSPGVPAGTIDPISGPMGTLQYDHGDGISITGGFVYRGTAIPELVGKYVFGDLALVPSSGGNPRIDGRLFWADLQTGEIKEFHLPQFANDKLPNGLTVHGFGQDGNGEIYAMVTNTPPNGNGGIVYQFVPVPEPSAVILLTVATVCGVCRRRR